MLKKLLIVVVIILLLVAGAAAYVVFNANAFIAKFQPIAEEKASAILGTPVRLGTISTGFFPNVHLDVDKLSVGAEANSPGVSLSNLTLDVGVKALLDKKLQINKLSLKRPSITFVRDESGIWIEGLPKKAPSATSSSKTAPPAANNPQSTTPVATPLAISLDLFEITDAQIALDDRILGKRFEIAPLNVAVKVRVEGTVARVVSLKVNGKALNFIPFSAKAENITFDQKTGKAKIPEVLLGLFSAQHALSLEVDTRELAGEFNLQNRAPLSIPELLLLGKILPPETQKSLEQFALAGGITPAFKGSFKLPSDVQVDGETGLQGLAAKVAAFSLKGLSGPIAVHAELPKQQVSSEKLSFQLNDKPIDLSFDAQLSHFKNFSLNNASLSAFGGSIVAKADAELSPTKPYSAEAKMTNVQISEAFAVLSPSAAKMIDGTLASLNVHANGVVNEQPVYAVQAQGDANIVKARLVGINIVGLIVKSIDGLPFLKRDLYSSIPESERGPIDAPDTEVDSITAQYSLKNGVLQLSQLSMYGPLFRLEASGSATLGMEVNLDATITLSSVVTGIMITAAKDFARIVDARGQLTFPLTIKGTLPKIMVYPDMGKIAALAAERALKEQAGKALDRALDKATGGKMKGIGGLLGF